jgi:hypothetical protein
MVLNEIHLARRRNVAYNFPSARELWAHCRGHRSRVDARVFQGTPQVSAGNAMNKKYGDAVHSRFAGQELDLICNHKFV